MQLSCQRCSGHRAGACKRLPASGKDLPAGRRNAFGTGTEQTGRRRFGDLARPLHHDLQESIYGLPTMEIDGFGLHETALRFRARRNQLLSSNIANADTPNYKARDIEFSTALKNAQQGGIGVERTSDLHIKSWGTARDGGEAMYRIPVQSALDGNTVETDVEQAAFAENALKYRASLAFLDGKLRTLRLAIKGGE